MAATVTLEEFSRQMGRLASGELLRSINQEADLLGRFGRSEMFTNATTSPKVRSGRLRNSTAYKVTNESGGVQIALSAGGFSDGANVAYAGIQDLGGTIRPKRAQSLAIPIGPARQRTGTARRAGPRDYPNLRFNPNARGKAPLLVDRDTGEPYFVLLRSVTVPPTFFMRNAFYEMLDRATIRLNSLMTASLEL